MIIHPGQELLAWATSLGDAYNGRHLCRIPSFVVTVQELNVSLDDLLCALSGPNKPA
jgi:hypothetical protein